jgi:hypothetical protein
MLSTETAKREEEAMTDQLRGEWHRTERLSHALYGLIIVTATLVAERHHIEEPIDALRLLLGTALVLLLAYVHRLHGRTSDLGPTGHSRTQTHRHRQPSSLRATP